MNAFVARAFRVADSHAEHPRDLLPNPTRLTVSERMRRLVSEPTAWPVMAVVMIMVATASSSLFYGLDSGGRWASHDSIREAANVDRGPRLTPIVSIARNIDPYSFGQCCRLEFGPITKTQSSVESVQPAKPAERRAASIAVPASDRPLTEPPRTRVDDAPPRLSVHRRGSVRLGLPVIPQRLNRTDIVGDVAFAGPPRRLKIDGGSIDDVFADGAVATVAHRLVAEPRSEVAEPRFEVARLSRGSEAVKAAAPVPPTDVTNGIASSPLGALRNEGFFAAPSLDRRLASLELERTSDDSDSDASSGTGSWIPEATAGLMVLRGDRTADREVIATLDRLSMLADRAVRQSPTLNVNSPAHLRAAATLKRRVELWRALLDYQDAASQLLPPAAGGGRFQHETDRDRQTQIRSAAEPLSSLGSWSKYLLVDEVLSMVGKSPPMAHRLKLSRQIESRIRSNALSNDQRRFVTSPVVSRYASALAGWSQTTVDALALAKQIERQESDVNHHGGIELAEASLRLRESNRYSVATQLADLLDSHYRNANLRMAVHADLINRVLPEPAPTQIPVRQTLLGSRIRGQSNVTSRLGITLSPNPNAWSLRLLTRSNLQTLSTASKSSVVVRTRSQHAVDAATPVLITPASIQAGRTAVRVDGTTAMRSIATPFDDVPLLGSWVRSMARGEFNESKPIASRINRRRITSETETKIQTELDQNLRRATSRAESVVMAPLRELSIEPEVVGLQTTSDRLIARYRLASDWQLAAATPRPAAPSDSMVSIQMHQSVINNALDRIIIRDRPVNLIELIDTAANHFGFEPKLPDDFPKDVQVQFTHFQPITIDINDGFVELTLRVQSLSRPGDRPLTKFIVTARYEMSSSGGRLELQRVGHLSIDGRRMTIGKRLPLRLIFNKVLTDDRPIVLTPPRSMATQLAGLVLSQTRLIDGWVAIAMAMR